MVQARQVSNGTHVTERLREAENEGIKILLAARLLGLGARMSIYFVIFPFLFFLWGGCGVRERAAPLGQQGAA